MKLTDTQLIILSKASQREDGAAILPPSLKGSAAQKVIGKLLEQGLLREIQTRGEMQAWRRDEQDRPLGLRITKRGLTAIAAEPADDDAEGANSASVKVNKNRGGSAKARASEKARSLNTNVEASLASSGPSQNRIVDASDGSRTGKAAPREGSKQALVISLLQRKSGAALDELIAATEWLPHTTRAALTGLRQKGFGILKSKESGKTVYRIDASSAAGEVPGNRASAERGAAA